MNYTAPLSRVDTLERQPPRVRPARDPREWDLVRAYASLVVPEHRTSGQVAHWYDGRPVYRPGWETRPYPVVQVELWRALFRGEKVDVRGVERVAYSVIDVDAHQAHDAAKAPRKKVVSIDEALRSRSGARLGAARRRAVHEAAWPTVRAILERNPGSFAEQTKRGYRVYRVFGTRVPVADARAIGKAMIAGVEAPPGVGLEVFPKIVGDGTGSMCALPLTGNGRLLQASGKRQHRTRVEDVEFFLQAMLDAQGTDLPVLEIPAAPAPDVLEPGFQTRSAVAHEGPMAQTFGADFGEQVRAILFDGIGDDESWPATAKIAFTEMALAIPSHVTDAAFAQWAAMPEHRATHTATASGRKTLARTLKSCRQYYARLVASGHLHPGRMRAPALRARIYQLAARAEERQAA